MPRKLKLSFLNLTVTCGMWVFKKNIYNIVKAKGMITNEKNIIIISSSLRRNGNSQLLCNQFMQGEH